MEEHGDHVGEPDDARSNQGSDDAASSDYLESLRARFDELASRIETATQESLERTHSLLTDPDTAAPTPGDESAPPPPAAADNGTAPPPVATEANQVPEVPEVTPPTAPVAAPPDDSDSRFRAPPAMLTKEPSEPLLPPPPPPPRAAATTAPVVVDDPAAVPETAAPVESQEIAPTGLDDELSAPVAAAPDVAPIQYEVVNTEEGIADHADLDAWDETAPPDEPVKGRPTPPPGSEISDPTTLGAQLRNNVHPVTTTDTRRKFIIPALAVVLVAVVAAGAWLLFAGGDDPTPAASGTTETTQPTSTPDVTTAPDVTTLEVERAAQQALSDADFTVVSVTVTGDTAVLEGTVDSEEAKTAAGIAVLAVDGITNVDSRIAVEIPPPPDPGETQAAAEEVLTTLGFDQLSVAVTAGTATVRGAMPLSGLEDGYFAYSAPAREALLAINGIDLVRTRLELRGFQGDLQTALNDLVGATPISFEVGSAELSPEAAAILDDAAALVIDSPGLGVIVVGSADPTDDAASNEALALARAEAMVLHLIGTGVTEVRLVAAPYGERRFEVLP